MCYEDYAKKLGFNVEKTIHETHQRRWNDLTQGQKDRVIILMRNSRNMNMLISISSFVRSRLNWRFSLDEENPVILYRVDARTFQFPVQNKIFFSQR